MTQEAQSNYTKQWPKEIADEVMDAEDNFKDLLFHLYFEELTTQGKFTMQEFIDLSEKMFADRKELVEALNVYQDI